MIISASRRTDIPAFYSDWFMNRISAGYCAVPNPFNRNQVSYVSLLPDEVEAIVFWTRNPAPLLMHLQELDDQGFHYYFQFTLVNNPKQIDPHSPALDKSVEVFQQLAERVGPARVIWRYDPIFLSNITSFSYHIDKYSHIAKKLQGYAKRSVISFVDDYRKASKRIRDLGQYKIEVQPSERLVVADVKDFVLGLVNEASANGIELQSCAENLDMTQLGVLPGKCIDDDLVKTLFKYNHSPKKDPSQRKECRCAISRDIGMYDSCLFGCSYCYATQSFELARKNHSKHKPDSPSLVGWYDAEPPAQKAKKKKLYHTRGNLF